MRALTVRDQAALAAASDGPPSVAGQVGVWWATDLEDTYADGASDISWPDRVGGLTLASVGSRYRATAINGESAVDTESNAWMDSSIANFNPSGTGCVVMVMKIDVSGGGEGFFWGSGDLGSVNFIGGGAVTNGTRRMIYQSRGAGTEDVIYGDTTINHGSNYVLEWSSNGTAIAMRANNVAQTLTVSAGANEGDWFGDIAARDNFTFGAVRRSTTTAITANLNSSFILVTNQVLSAGDRTSLYAWINSVYGI